MSVKQEGLGIPRQGKFQGRRSARGQEVCEHDVENPKAVVFTSTLEWQPFSPALWTSSGVVTLGLDPFLGVSLPWRLSYRLGLDISFSFSKEAFLTGILSLAYLQRGIKRKNYG